MTKILCTDPRHDLRQGLPGWQTTLGETSRGQSPDGYVCGACVSMRQVEAVAQVSHPATHTLISGDGGFAVRVALVYADTGDVVGYATMKIGKLVDKLSGAERTALVAMFAKLRS